MSDKRFIVLFILFLAVHRLSMAAVFTVENDTGYDIKLSGNWTNQLSLKSGASMRFDSGLKPLTNIRWLHKTEGRYCYIQYNQSLNIPATALGGRFKLGKDGAFEYNFDTMGGSGKGSTKGTTLCAGDRAEWESWAIEDSSL